MLEIPRKFELKLLWRRRWATLSVFFNQHKKEPKEKPVCPTTHLDFLNKYSKGGIARRSEVKESFLFASGFRIRAFSLPMHTTKDFSVCCRR